VAALDPDNVKISWTVKELLERLERKVDQVITHHDGRIEALERQDRPIPDGVFRMAAVETKVDANADAIKALAASATGASAISIFKERAWARLVGIAVMAGATAGVLSLLVSKFL
jgi:hypothetical protein